MPPLTRYRPRITFEITEEQYNVIKEYIEFGLQKKFFGAIVDDIVPLLQEFGFAFVLAMLEHRFSYRSFMLEQQSGRSTDQTVSESLIRREEGTDTNDS